MKENLNLKEGPDVESQSQSETKRESQFRRMGTGTETEKSTDVATRRPYKCRSTKQSESQIVAESAHRSKSQRSFESRISRGEESRISEEGEGMDDSQQKQQGTQGAPSDAVIPFKEKSPALSPKELNTKSAEESQDDVDDETLRLKREIEAVRAEIDGMQPEPKPEFNGAKDSTEETTQTTSGMQPKPEFANHGQEETTQTTDRKKRHRRVTTDRKK